MGRCKRVGRDPVGGNDCGRSNDSVPVSSDFATGIKKEHPHKPASFGHSRK